MNRKNLLIHAALKNEIEPTKKYLNILQFDTIKIKFLTTGVGKEKTIIGISDFTKKNNIDHILNIGTCGSLNTNHQLGTIFIPDTFLGMVKNSLQKIDIVSLFFNQNNGFKYGKIYTSEKAVDNQQDKLKIQKETGADAVDMETFWLAEHCQKKGIEFTSDRKSVV